MYPALLRSLLLRLEAEKSHKLALNILQQLHNLQLVNNYTASTPVECMGMKFANAVGLAAGFDKNADYIDALGAMGFGFIEVGTVTPKPEVGQPKPRLFFLKEIKAVVNGVQSANLGVDYLVDNLKNCNYEGHIGVNIGKNSITVIEDSTQDYIYCLKKVYPYASYITLNFCLEILQSQSILPKLLKAIKKKHNKLAHEYGFYVPLVVKVSPDVSRDEVKFIAKQLLEYDIDGIVCTNATMNRHGVEKIVTKDQQGLLSGQPINHISTVVLEQFADELQGKLAIIGVGGIDNPTKAVNKLEAGANLVQLYSGLIYQGPILIRQCIQATSNYLARLTLQKNSSK